MDTYDSLLNQMPERKEGEEGRGGIFWEGGGGGGAGVAGARRLGAHGDTQRQRHKFHKRQKYHGFSAEKRR